MDPIPSTSPTLPRSWTYDVFLSFRGPDTRTNFTDHLYNSLVHKGIKTFRADQVLNRRGNDLSLKILKALEESRIYIVIFSRNYASSSLCLDELVQILHCRENMSRSFIVPIFYKVDPSEIRNQTGGVGEALAIHEERLQNIEKVSRWRTALRDFSELSGWIFSDDQYETTFIHKIVEDISVLLFEDSSESVPRIKIEDLRITHAKAYVRKSEETRIWMHDMIEEPQNYRMATSTAWIFLLTNVGLEISSAMFDQFSSPSNNPQGALISMVLAILAVIISIWELIHKGLKERVKYRRQLGIFGWFYSRSGNKIFGSVPDMCGLLGGISQCVYAIVQYVFILRHIKNPYKIYLWPIIFLLCLGASRLQWNQRNLTKKLKQ